MGDAGECRRGQDGGVTMVEDRQNFASSAVSCADLIRASIALHQRHFTKMMDCRVKPGNDSKHVDATQT
jgi:hypothetical protein